MTATNAAAVDPVEIERFSAMAADWWNPAGKFRPLHKFNPVRLDYIKRQACARFGRRYEDADALSGLRLLDIGCGGGLLSEPMARLGASVTGVDPSPVNIEVAALHARQSGLAIDYRAATAEALREEGERFDIVLNMEVVEHVPDVAAYLAACAALVKPGGLMFIATINRTPKAFALAIVAAERILRWLPAGTHRYEKLVRPQEIEGPLAAAGMEVIDRTGVAYNPLRDRWGLTADMDVNYMILAGRPAA
jgi:2-polyprenyl-6-hydroxyphenyl methylase/3-demethylubiquinone-9 3-methyltransferase